MLLLLFFAAPVTAVCPHCKDVIPGCAGGDACPLVVEHAANVEIFRTGTVGSCPTVAHALPTTMRAIFTPALCEALVGIATAPAGGLSADLTDRELYPTPTAIVRASRYGHTTEEEAIMELSMRTEGADETEMGKIKAAVEMVKAVGGKCLTGVQGIYTFIWAKTAQLITRASEAVRLMTTTTANRLYHGQGSSSRA